MKKSIIISLAVGCVAVQSMAQSGTNSPYSQYGLGILSEQAQGFNRGMNGLALGLRYGNQVNSLNPASYSAIDSLTMIFDVGLSGQITNFKEGNVSRNAKNADFEYAVAAFRVFPKVGLSIGLIPFTNIGYDYTSTSRIGTSETTTAETHTGSGGIHQAFVGVGWNVFSGLSLGANISYLWGSYERQISISSSDAYVNTMVRTYGATVNSYKLDFGLQWEQRMAKDDRLTLGATVGIGHKLGADPEVTTTSSNSQTGVSSDNTFTVENGLAIPMSYGVGVAWSHGGKFTIGADYSLQQWGSVDLPETDVNTGKYVMKSGLLKDRHKVTLGGEWVPNEMSLNLLERVHYRAGVSYATPYVTIQGMDGPKEYSVSAGFGIPITNTYNNRSFLNISGQRLSNTNGRGVYSWEKCGHEACRRCSRALGGILGDVVVFRRERTYSPGHP